MRNFEFVKAISAADAAEQLAAVPDAMLKSAGTDLIDRMKSFIDMPSRVVSLSDVSPLRLIEKSRIGSLVTLAQLAAAFRDGPYAALGHAAGEAGTPQIRNVATVGGNLCQRPRCGYYRLGEVACLKKGGKDCPAIKGDNRYHAIFETDPCPFVHPSNLGGPLVAFDAVIHIQGPKEKREVPASKFFALPKADIRRENILSRDEVVTGVTLPDLAAGTKSAYLEGREKESFDWSLVNATAVLHLDGVDCKAARIVLGSVAPIPWHVPAAEKLLVGKKITEATAAAAAKAAFDGAKPLSGNKYKIPMGIAITKRAILAAAGLWKE